MALLPQFTAAGVRFKLLAGGKLRATGNLTNTTRALIRTHKPEILAELTAVSNASARQWRVGYPDLPMITVIFVPPATRAEVAEVYPGASIEPIPDTVTWTATPAVTDEVRRLVSAILAGDSEADRAEALAVALADPEAALLCFRALALASNAHIMT
jgi:hypothetical protein